MEKKTAAIKSRSTIKNDHKYKKLENNKYFFVENAISKLLLIQSQL
jgi:hypothetical protein